MTTTVRSERQDSDARGEESEIGKLVTIIDRTVELYL